MKVKFKTTNKGRITQEFAEDYKGVSHSGIDSVLGWNKVVTCDNDCYVYKTITSDQSGENWQAVYMLVKQSDDIFVEVTQGHFNKLLVKEGQYLVEYQAIGLEGNKGKVRSGGVEITPAMQKAGDQRGTHTHTSYRPTYRVKETKRGANYLMTRAGTKFKDPEGYYYEIIHKDSATRGCVNPREYEYKNTMMEDLLMLTKLLTKLKK